MLVTVSGVGVNTARVILSSLSAQEVVAAILYDDVKTFSIYTELEVELSKRMVVGANTQINSYTLTNQQEAWNTPKMKGEIFGTYKTEKWFWF